MHGLHDSPAHPLASRSPAFSSPPSHGTAASAAAGSFSGQLSSLSPANVYSGSSPGMSILNSLLGIRVRVFIAINIDYSSG